MRQMIMWVVLGLCHLGFAQEITLDAGKRLALHESLAQSLNFYDLRELQNSQWTKAIHRGETIELDLLGQLVEAQLQPYSLRAKNFRSVMILEDGSEVEVNRPVPTYRGSLIGIPDSDVRLIITDEMITGTVKMEGEVYFFQPVAKFHKKMGTDITVIYRDSDVQEGAKAFCGMEYHEKASENLMNKLSFSTYPKVVQIGLDTDGEFVQAHPGQNISDLLEGYINQLDAIWRADLDLQLEITGIFVRSNPATDPWNSTPYGHGPTRFGPLSGGDNCLQPGDGVFEQFRNYWNSTSIQLERDIMVLFVGRDLKLCPTANQGEAELFGTAGFLGTICRYPDRAYVVQEEYPINTAGLLAHEIGHSLDGIHINHPDCNPGFPIGPVLCGTVEAGSDYYASSNITRIGNFLNSHGNCLGEEVHFTCTADAYVIPNWPNNNYGVRNEVFVRTSPIYDRNGYFKFNVTGLTSTISSAKLRMKVGPVTIPSAMVYGVAHNNWGEFTITWNNAPAFLFKAEKTGVLPANTWIEIDVSSIVNNGNGVYTIGITAPHDIPNLYFRSRQSTDKPTLIIRTDD